MIRCIESNETPVPIADGPPNPLPDLVVVGNGMAGHRFVKSLLKRSPERYRITILGEEPHPAYDRVNLTTYFDHRSVSDLLLSPTEWYIENHIQLLTGIRVESIDRAEKSIRTTTGEIIRYDTLVLATGSRPFIPSIEGVNLQGVFAYRTIKDLDSIRSFSQKCHSATVIGGGLLGLEAAYALAQMGCETTIVERSNGLLPRQLNEEGAAVLIHKVAQLGIRLKLKSSIEKIQKTSDGLKATFHDGSSVHTEMIVFSAGIVPQDDLARSCDLPVGARGGIRVDDRLQTVDPDIYALGECASHRGVVYGFVSPCYQQAEVLSDHLSGYPATYEGSDFSCRLKLLGVEVGVFGDYLGEGEHYTYRNRDCYRMIVVHHGKLVGATVVGAWKQADSLDRCVKEKNSVSKGVINRFIQTGNLSILDACSHIQSWPATALVCNCTQTTCGQLRMALEGGCKTVDDLSRVTGAGTVCGSCVRLLSGLVSPENGIPEMPNNRREGRLLKITASLATVIVLVFLLFPPLPVPNSVQGWYYDFTLLWKESVTKQITGYSLAGASALAVLLSARKRLKWLQWGSYTFWRIAHSFLGTFCLFGLILHTGLNTGDNLNQWLLFCFLGLNTLGALAAFTIALDDRFSGPKGRIFRLWLTRAHILFFWPYPVLLGIHIAKVTLY